MGSRVRRYGIAILLIAAASFLRWALEPTLQGQAPFLPFLLAVPLAAWLGGLGPGVLATALAAVVSYVVFLHPGGEPAVTADGDRVALALFVLTGIFSSAVATAARSAQWRAERHAKRTTRLQAVTEAVARPMSQAEVANAILCDGFQAFGSGRGVVALLDEKTNEVRIVSAIRYDGAVIHDWQSFPLEGNYPAAEAIRERQLLILEHSGQARARYPELASTIPDSGCAVVVPLLYEERAIGSIYWRFDERLRFDDDDRMDLLAIGHSCAAAIERARLYDRERAAAIRAELVARAGEQLAESRDDRRAVRDVARLAASEIADWVAVHVLDQVGSVRLLALGRREGDGEPVLRALRRFGRPLLSDPRGPGAVIREGSVERVDHVDAEDVERLSAGDERRRAGLEGLVGGSYAIVPLVSRGRVLGSLSLLDAPDGGRRIDDHDVALGEELARRIGIALDNAALYRDLNARVNQQAAVARIGQRALEEPELDDLFRDALAELTATLGIEFAELLELTPDGDLLLVGGVGWRDGHVGRTRISAVAGSQAGYTLVSHEPVIVVDLATETRFVPSTLLHEHEIRSGMSVIIGSVDDPWGVLGVQTQRLRRFTGHDINFLTAVANVLAEAIEKRRKSEREREAQEIGRAFIGVVNHELRTPITTIYAGAKLLRRIPPTDSEWAGIAEDVEAESDRLYRLTEDLLVLTRLERDDLRIAREPVLLTRLVDRVLAVERRRWPVTAFEIVADPDLPTAMGEDSYVEQVLRNLLSNAAKYSPSASTVTVRLTADAEDVSVRILDEGAGIGSTDPADLFALFYRSPATAQQASGAGIGLFVCQRLVAAMGGRLWARNRDGEAGSEFGFALRHYRAEDAEEPRPPNGRGSTGLRDAEDGRAIEPRAGSRPEPSRIAIG